MLKNKGSILNCRRQNGFTLIEILVVIAIIGVLVSVVIISVNKARDRAYYVKAKIEYESIITAIYFYKDAHGFYPPDADRNIPPGIEVYLAGDTKDYWPKAPWPGSVYDWDNWDDPDNPGKKIYQISIRFCPIGGQLSQCSFPNEDWAKDFKVNSSAYYCLSGACRAHIDEPIDYPGYCMNCN